MNHTNIDYKEKFSHKVETFSAFLSLYLKYVLRNKLTFFFLFIFPILLGVILGMVIPSTFVFPSISLLPVMASGFISLAGAIAEWKKSTVIKNIGLTSLTKGQFLFGVTSVNCVFGILAYMFTIGILYAISISSSFTTSIENIPLNIFDPTYSSTETITVTLVMTFEYVIWGQLIFFVLMMSLVSMAIGYLIGNVSKSINQANLIGVLTTLLVAFLSGIFLDVYSIQKNGGIKYLSMILPTTYINYGYMNAFYGWYNVGAFDLNSTSKWFIGNNPFAIESANDYIKVNYPTNPLIPLPTTLLYTTQNLYIDTSVSIATWIIVTSINYLMTNFSKRK